MLINGVDVETLQLHYRLDVAFQGVQLTQPANHSPLKSAINIMQKSRIYTWQPQRGVWPARQSRIAHERERHRGTYKLSNDECAEKQKSWALNKAPASRTSDKYECLADNADLELSGSGDGFTLSFEIVIIMALLVRTALMMTLSPGSVRTISEAPLAASVASATAIPISAFFSAGASLTPSPVIPQIFFTISYLCSGNTPANPSAFSISSSTGRALIAGSLFCPNKAEEGYMLVPIPSLRPVSLAIAS
ncbi:hypothetical protein IEQ34_011922 [Dendrobium chrysotoxum]|uniref:Uncharacterized protein n=1 Tax=Dendrobium chrysotoxum TaxID=161865 RepID=A0AAV7GU06_DENCH|nr:hypothetical protein IEQ34_011922 [Dendrobium chrysotoxum]